MKQPTCGDGDGLFQKSSFSLQIFPSPNTPFDQSFIVEEILTCLFSSLLHSFHTTLFKSLPHLSDVVDITYSQRFGMLFRVDCIGCKDDMSLCLRSLLILNEPSELRPMLASKAGTKGARSTCTSTKLQNGKNIRARLRELDFRTQMMKLRCQNFHRIHLMVRSYGRLDMRNLGSWFAAATQICDIVCQSVFFRCRWDLEKRVRKFLRGSRDLECMVGMTEQQPQLTSARRVIYGILPGWNSRKLSNLSMRSSSYEHERNCAEKEQEQTERTTHLTS
ncbi:hypothetical protein KCV03_g226, partial [Aureobasidium melanogenum]